MNRKLVLLNLLLVVFVTWLGWTLKQRWDDTEARHREFLNQTIKAGQVQQLAPPGPIDKAVPADYIEVAQRTLFSKDRNPNVPIDAPPPAPAPPPVPPFPVYHGQMNFGDPVVILSTTGNDQKGYHAGEVVGKFKLVAFDSQTITLEFDGKNLERRLSDLVPPANVPPPVPQPANSSVSTSAPTAATSLAGGTGAAHTNDSPELGVDMGGSRACVPGDSSPAGTIRNGYKKVITQGLMGATCYWEQVSTR